MTRSSYFRLAVACGAVFLAVPATARPRFLPRLHLPKINLVKGLGAATYPVTKSLVNGGKTVFKTAFKTAAAAETLGALPSIGPPGVNTVARKIIVEVGKR